MNVRIESPRSIYLIDEAAGTYVRMPRTEAPRDARHLNGWGDDLVVHPMTGWELVGGVLTIHLPDGTRLASPDAVEATPTFA